MKTNQFNPTEEQRESVILTNTLLAIQQAKISKEAADNVLHPLLTAAVNELKSINSDMQQACITMFIRNLFFVFSIQREQNYWKEEGIKAPVSGAQMRTAGRSILRWMHDNPLMKEWLQRRDEQGLLKSYKLVVEHNNYGILYYNQITTGVQNQGKRGKGSKVNPAKTLRKEKQNTPLSFKVEIAAQAIRASKHLSLLARHLPKSTTGKNRYTTLVVGQTYKSKSFNSKDKAWVKLNGIEQKQQIFDVKEGDTIRYPRLIGKDAKERINTDNLFIDALCAELGWSNKEYNAFRHQHMQNTPEHKFSSGTISAMNKEQFMKWLSALSGGQQHVVSTHLCYANESKQLVANPNGKWYNTDLPQWYLEFARKDEKVAEQARVLMSKGDQEGAKMLVDTKMKMKVTGKQTIDFYTDMIGNKKSDQEIDTAFLTLTAKAINRVPLFVCFDTSASMTTYSQVINNERVTNLDIIAVLGLTFMLTNPSLEFGSCCMFYGSDGTFAGITKFRNVAENQWMEPKIITTEATKIVDRTKTFTQNLKTLKAAMPGTYARTNPGKVVESFVELVAGKQFSVEELPKVLLFLTDDEGNTGMEPREFAAKANSIGWNPLFVFWGVKGTDFLEQYKGIPNVLVERGFSENNLTNILQFITKGSINMYDSLWSVYDNPAYQAINY